MVFVPSTGCAATTSHKSGVLPSTTARRCRPRSERINSPSPLSRALQNISHMSPSRSQTVTTRVSGQAIASCPALSSRRSQRTLSGSASPAASAPSRWVALSSNTPSGRRVSLIASPTWARIPLVPEPPPPRSTRPVVLRWPL